MTHRICVITCSVASLLAFTGITAAQSNAFNGSWKADLSTYHFMGAKFTVAVDADGYTVNPGSGGMPKVVCDGKPHSTPDKTMLTCSKSPKGYSITETKDSKPVRETSIVITADGKTLTRTSKIYPSQGSPFTMTNISGRVSGGPGFEGEWVEKSFSSTDDSGVLTIAIKGDSVDFKETDVPKPITCKLDGSDQKIDGGTMSVKLADDHTLKVTYKDDHGKMRRENTFALSSDKKSIMETDLTPAPSTSKMSVVLHKM